MKNTNLENQQNDKNLHQTFVRLGNGRRLLAHELLAVLPEIFERGIYKKYARTIEEYAAKFGGLSGLVVRKRLRLEKYVKDKPNLKAAIVNDGVHKVALVASLATVENEAAWADKVRNMSKPAIQELSKEVRHKMKNSEIGVGEGVNMNLFGGRGDHDGNCKTTLCAAAPQQIRVNLEGELFFMFLKLKKKYGDNLTNQEVIKKIFEENLSGNFQRKFQNAEDESAKVEVRKMAETEKNSQPQSVKSIPGDRNSRREFCDANEEIGKEKEIPQSRYIKISLRRNLLQKTAGFCSYPNCSKPAEVFHHTDRFANSHSHESIKPICKIHHEFAHNGLIQNENYDVQDWRLQLQNEGLDKIDQLYSKYRKAWQR